MKNLNNDLLNDNSIRIDNVKRVPKNFKSEIIEDYTNGMSSYQIAKKYELKSISVQKFLGKIGIIRSGSEAAQKYKINNDLFVDIDCEWKAYFLGWIASDGNIYLGARRHTISLAIIETDKYILEYFNGKIFNGLKPLNYRNARFKKGTQYYCKPLYRFSIDNKKMCNDLINLGITNNKSNTIGEIKIPNEFIKHFIRGVFEGDGCIAKNNSGKKVIFFTNSSRFKEWLIFLLKNELNIEPKVYYKNTGLYNIVFHKKKEIKLFYDYIYSDCEMFLLRKKEKFKQ